MTMFPFHDTPTPTPTRTPTPTVEATWPAVVDEPERNRYFLLLNRRDEYLTYGVPLYRAAFTGDWKFAKQIHLSYPNCFTERITRDGNTALHIAALARHTDFVVKLVNWMVHSQCQHYLMVKNNVGNTAFCLAATSGTVAIAEVMNRVNPDLPMIRGSENMTPLHMAALLGHRDMVDYLRNRTFNLSGKDLDALFFSSIYSGLYDIAIDMLSAHGDLALARDEQNETALHVLAKSNKSYYQPSSIWRKCCNFFNESGRHNKCEMQRQALFKCIWKRVIQESQDDIALFMAVPWRLLFVAVEVGNVEFVIALISSYPDIIWKLDDKRRTIFHVAVTFRQERIFKLIYEIGGVKDLLVTYVDKSTGNNILHLAALLPSSNILNSVSGPALQMQREISWFKAVEDLLQPQDVERPNLKGQKPWDLFTEEHKELRKEGEEWMRKTASSCSFVATLIASVAYGVASKTFNTSATTGSNLFGNGWYRLYAILGYVSCISSTSAILMFLSILTSRYAEEDFFKSLPRKLMVGLTMLFLSVATMMIALTAIFSIINVKSGLIGLAFAFGCVPIIFFASQQLLLLTEVYPSIIGCDLVPVPRNELFSQDS